MSDEAAATAPSAPAKVTKKRAASSKAKKPADHPKYSQMIKESLNALKERGGSSRQAILKYLLKHYHLGSDEKAVNSHLKMALRAGVKNGSLKQSKGTGASGSFRVGDKEPKAAKHAKPKAARKPKAKKAKAAGSPKKAAKPKAKKAAGEAKPKAKKPKSPTKAKAAKPKAAKKPKAASAKPKKAKSPKKPKAAKPKKAAAKK